MSEEKHTPLPWVGFSDQGKCVAIMPAGRSGDVCTFAQPPSNTDADLILRSVNALPALVKALEVAIDLLIPFHEDGDQLAITKAIEDGRAALAAYRKDS